MNLLGWMARLLPAVAGHSDHEGPETTRAVLAPDLAISAEGWLVGEGVTLLPSRRTQALVHHRPLGFVWHWTATRGAGIRLARSIRDLPREGERAASWGTLIPAAGDMIQSAPLTLGTWHAGGPSAAAFRRAPVGGLNQPGLFWPPGAVAPWLMADHDMTHRGPGEVSANSLFHGVEIENAGEVRRHQGKWRSHPFDERGVLIPDDEVLQVDGRSYHRIADHQAAQAERLVRAAALAYDLPRESFLLTHRMIDPSRKVDPEPTWTKALLPALLDRVF